MTDKRMDPHERFIQGAMIATQSCNCIGPQIGFPKCPCLMKGVVQRDGRWIEPEKDLGPVGGYYG